MYIHLFVYTSPFSSDYSNFIGFIGDKVDTLLTKKKCESTVKIMLLCGCLHLVDFGVISVYWKKECHVSYTPYTYLVYSGYRYRCAWMHVLVEL